MRDTAAFANLVETSLKPIIATKNGYDQFVVLHSRDYDAPKNSEAKSQLMSPLSLAEQERPRTHPMMRTLIKIKVQRDPKSAILYEQTFRY